MLRARRRAKLILRSQEVATPAMFTVRRECAGQSDTRQPDARRPDAPRLVRERRTIRAMVALYCREQHPVAHRSPAEEVQVTGVARAAAGPDQAAPGGAALCPDCWALQEYAFARLDRCPYGAAKPTCTQCPIHCYRPAMREQVRVVMRYAGPRMLWRHPLLSLLHQWDSFRSRGVQSPPPSRSGKGAGG